MAGFAHLKRPPDDKDSAPHEHQKPKLSELPIDQAKRSAIDGLAHNFRKKGEYDNIRNTVRAQFEASVSITLNFCIAQN